MIGSDGSMRKILDHLPKKELHGNRVVATTATPHNLRRFEDAARKDNPTPGQNGQNNDGRGDSRGPPPHGRHDGPPHNNFGPRDGPPSKLIVN